ncbi:hypothetical protein EG832_13905 [bacterium]|nr:hypothetical protein [bacterium]
MRNAKIRMVLVFLCLLSCAENLPRIQNIEFIRFSDGFTIRGEANHMTKTIILIMPNNEVIKGRYMAVANATFSAEFAEIGKTTAMSYGTTTSTRGNGYALLRGNQGTLVEFVFQFNPMDREGHGFGEARTNKGEIYKVIF